MLTTFVRLFDFLLRLYSIVSRCYSLMRCLNLSWLKKLMSENINLKSIEFEIITTINKNILKHILLKL